MITWLMGHINDTYSIFTGLNLTWSRWRILSKHAIGFPPTFHGPNNLKCPSNPVSTHKPSSKINKILKNASYIACAIEQNSRISRGRKKLFEERSYGRHSRENKMILYLGKFNLRLYSNDSEPSNSVSIIFNVY